MDKPTHLGGEAPSFAGDFTGLTCRFAIMCLFVMVMNGPHSWRPSLIAQKDQHLFGAVLQNCVARSGVHKWESNSIFFSYLFPKMP
jgi:hypothetical protein